MIYSATTRLAEAALRLVRGGNAAWRQRLVLDEAPGAAAIWLHGASVGELTSARPLIAALAGDHSLLATANSETGRELLCGWDVPARLAPFDAPGVLRRFLDAVRPAVQVTIEGEFWPGRSAALAARGVPQIMVGARMSARSASRWARARGVIAPMLGRIAALSAQDEASEARLLALGLPAGALLPRLDLKLLGPALLLAPAWAPGRALTVLAASTHRGEDAAVLDGFLAARAIRPDLRLILAPRHPQRGDEIAALLSARDLPVRRRSQGAVLPQPVLLADTLGEMARWYAQAGLCLVGGSWVERGGHTPWEPAAHGCAILHGPHVANFAGPYARLAAQGAARQVAPGGLGAALGALAGDPAAARAMGQGARAVLIADAGDPAPLLARIRSLASGAGASDTGTMKGGRG